MFEKGIGANLAERKRLIILEAALHRARIETECAALDSRFCSARANLGVWKLGIAAGGALAGLAAARHRRGLLRWIPTAIATLRWFRMKQ